MENHSSGSRKVLLDPVLTVLINLVFILSGFVLILIAFHRTGDSWDKVLEELGAVLIAIGAIHFAHEVLVRQRQQAAAEKSTRRLIKQELGTLRADTIEGLRAVRSDMKSYTDVARFGLEKIHRFFTLRSLLADLSPGDTLWVLDTYDQLHQTWMEQLEAALARGVQVRFLVIDPGSALVEMRASELGDRAYRSGAYAFSAALETRRHPNLHIRYYNDLPCAPLYVVERDERFARGYTSYFLDRPTNVDFPHLEWTANEHLGPRFLTYVKAKWERAEAPLISTATPAGQWIYRFTVRLRNNRPVGVYGLFTVHRQRVEVPPRPHAANQARSCEWKIFAEGQAFYAGEPPDRARRRGIWRSTRVSYDVDRTLTIYYDMVIQNHGESRDPRPSELDRHPKNQYEGFMHLERAGNDTGGELLEGPLTGTINSMPSADVVPDAAIMVERSELRGRVDARRLRYAIDPDSEDFEELLDAAFRSELGVDILQPVDAGDGRCPPPPKASVGNGSQEDMAARAEAYPML